MLRYSAVSEQDPVSIGLSQPSDRRRLFSF